MQFRGLNGEIVLENDEILIKRSSRLDKTFHDEEIIIVPLAELEDVEVVYGSVTNGYISLIIRNQKHKPGLLHAMKDKYSVIFRVFNNSKAEEMMKYILKQIENMGEC